MQRQEEVKVAIQSMPAVVTVETGLYPDDDTVTELQSVFNDEEFVDSAAIFNDLIKYTGKINRVATSALSLLNMLSSLEDKLSSQELTVATLISTVSDNDSTIARLKAEVAASAAEINARTATQQQALAAARQEYINSKEQLQQEARTLRDAATIRKAQTQAAMQAQHRENGSLLQSYQRDVRERLDQFKKEVKGQDFDLSVLKEHTHTYQMSGHDCHIQSRLGPANVP